jgi:hypothetical protein
MGPYVTQTGSKGARSRLSDWRRSSNAPLSLGVSHVTHEDLNRASAARFHRFRRRLHAQ